jgi:uncharacterized lipoprotein
MKIGIALLAFAMLLCACSSTPTPSRWTKFGFTHQQFETDWAECQKQDSPGECMSLKGYVEDSGQ